MINKTSLKSQNFNKSETPLKRSMIVGDNNYFIDLNGSARSAQSTLIKRNSNLDSKRSIIHISGIQFPGSEFIARKLKRIITRYLSNVFKTIRNYRVPIINLNLLGSKSRRSLTCGFFAIRMFAQLNKGDKLYQLLTNNKRPNLLYSSVSRVIKRNQKQVIKLLKSYNRRRKRLQNFLNILDQITRRQLKEKMKKIFMRGSKFKYISSLCKKDSTKQIFLLLKTIYSRLKLQTFKHLILSIKTKQFQKTFQNKKELSSLLTQQARQRYKSLEQERSQLRNIKYTIDNSAADRSKTRYQLRKDLNNLRVKIKEQQKNSKIVTTELNSQNSKLQSILAQIRAINWKRLSRIESQITCDTVKNIYKSIYDEKANQMGEIKLKNFTKQQLVKYDKQIEKLDQYHTFKNQKLRQQIFQYQNLQVFKSVWPEEQLVLEQNRKLKQMIQCLVFRNLDNFIHKDVLKEQQNEQNE